MRYFKKLKTNKGGDIPVCFDTTSFCPRCNSAIEPIYLHGYVNDLDKSLLSIFLQCNACHNPFISTYKCQGKVKFDYTDHIGSSLLKSEPISIAEQPFSNEIRKISSDFVKVYNQAYSADQNGLDEICGIGYRKAIEYLVKDYSIHISPKDKDKIKSQTLSTCINTYFDNKKLKPLALAATWLGNDQTHYEQRITDAGIKEMKAFIMALVNFIDSDLQADIAASLIDSK